MPPRSWLLVLAFALACGGTSTSNVTVRMSFARSDVDFFSAPFPSEDLRSADGTIDLDDYPGDRGILLAGAALTLLNHHARGFGNTSPIYFPFTDTPGSNLPSPDESIEDGASVQLFDVSVSPPLAYRVRVEAVEFAGVFGVPNLLGVLPVQGLPLAPGHRYAAVVRSSVGDSSGVRLGVSPEMRGLLSGAAPASLPAAAAAKYLEAIEALRAGGVRVRDVAGIAVFETQDPIAEMREFYAAATALTHPALEAPLTNQETHPDYCVFRSTIRMPTYQAGATPYGASGGGWARGVTGAPEVQANLLSNVVITVPRRTMPAGGFPTVIYIRAGGTGLQPLVDRGTAPSSSVGPTPGTGPAMIFAQAGFAAISIDGPVGGLRNPGGEDEQFLLFNTLNTTALLDNVRESALETGLAAHLLGDFVIDASTASCPGLSVSSGTNVTFDTSKIALFGHSMGASIAPLAAAVEPRIRAMILSGAGASWLENMIYKEHPVDVRAFLQGQLDVANLTRLDPGVGMIQWAGESADAQVFARHLVHEPLPGSPRRHVLMFQGIVDHYIMPPIANALSLAGGFDLAGQGLEPGVAEIADLEPLATLLPWTGRVVVPYPVTGNLSFSGTSVTAAVAQHAEDGIQDGHEVFFQLEAPRHQARCFLESFAATGSPVIVAPASLATPCP